MGLRNLCRSRQSSTCINQTIDQGKTITIPEALSQMFAIPSISGPSLQPCEYHVNVFLVGKSPLSPSKYLSENNISGKDFGESEGL